MSKPKFYAISNGRKTGIYTSWNEAQKQVTGFKNANYKSYPSLTEALQAMKINGYDNPPIFRHQDVPMSSSDTELRTTVLYSETLPSTPPIIEIEHPEIAIDNLFINESKSSTEIRNVPTSSSNTHRQYSF